MKFSVKLEVHIHLWRCIELRRRMINREVTEENVVTLFLCGDVMTGRGLDQIMPHPADPAIHEF